MPRVTRRDFLNGFALAIAVGAAPSALVAGSAAAPSYAPGERGFRGSHPGAYDVAHALRDVAWFDIG